MSPVSPIENVFLSGEMRNTVVAVEISQLRGNITSVNLDGSLSVMLNFEFRRHKMKRFLSHLCIAAIFLAGVGFTQAEEEKVSAKCPVSGKGIDKSHTVAFNGGDVFFCCPNCPNAFKANKDKFAAKANHQLVLTEQAKQKACPFSGQPIDESKTVQVTGVKVAFCCGNCLAKAKKSEGDKLVAAVFANGPFKKGFEVPEKK